MFGMYHPKFETIDLSDVHLFVAVAERASFIAASRKTGVPTSTVSRAVARLEDSLGVRLLHRTSRRVSPTQEGAWLLSRAAPLVDELGEVLAGIGERDEEPAGRLRVTAPIVTGSQQIARALTAFAAAHPRVSVELHLTNAVVNLVEAGFDLAFRAGPIADTDLIARKLWTGRFVLAAAPGFVKRVLKGRRNLSAEKLTAIPAVVTRSGVAWRFLAPDGGVRELTPQESFVVNDPRVAIEAAKAGLGIVRAPQDLVEREKSALELLECELGEPEGRDMYAVYPSRRLVPRRVQAAIEWVLREHVGDREKRRFSRASEKKRAPAKDF